MNPMPSSRPGDRGDTKQALLEALHESVQDAHAREVHDAERTMRAARRRASPVILGGAVIAVGLAAWLLLARPAWVFPPSGPVQSAQQLEAGLRIGLYLEARKVREYQARTGRPPRTLAEAGLSASASAYTLRPDGRWVLQASQGGQTLRVTADDSLSTFLGSSFSHLRGGRR